VYGSLPSAGITTDRVRRSPRTMGRPSAAFISSGTSGSSPRSSAWLIPAAAASAICLAAASGSTSIGACGVASIRMTKFCVHTPSRLGSPNDVRGAR